MRHLKVPNMPPGMAANPYSSPRDQTPRKTLCELCDRSINTPDWPYHKNSKKHRALEDAEKAKENVKVDSNGPDGWSGDVSVFTANAGSGFDFAPAESGTDGWGTSGGTTNGFGSVGYGSKTGTGGGDRACFGCGEVGHNKRDCPKGGASGDRACFACGEIGHNKRDCPKGGSTGGGQTCFNCGKEGHRKLDCPEPLKPRTGGGGAGGRACFNCLQPGHNSSDCSEPRVERCRNCDAEGHHSRECPKPRDWSRVKCRNCYKFGHGERRCPELVGGADTSGNGGWSNGDDAGAATAAGSWDDGGGDPSAAAAASWSGDDAGAGAQESSGNWADDVNATA